MAAKDPDQRQCCHHAVLGRAFTTQGTQTPTHPHTHTVTYFFFKVKSTQCQKYCVPIPVASCASCDGNEFPCATLVAHCSRPVLPQVAAAARGKCWLGAPHEMKTPLPRPKRELTERADSREIVEFVCWAEARLKIARMTLTIKLDGNWSSFQLANSAPPLSVTDSALAPSARIVSVICCSMQCCTNCQAMLGTGAITAS